MCRSYGQRPSAVLGIEDPEVAFDFDLACNVVHEFERDSRVRQAAEQNDATVGLLQAALDR